MKSRIVTAVVGITFLTSACGAEGSAPIPSAAVPTVTIAAEAANPAVQERAEEICRAAVWTGIDSRTSFQEEFDANLIPGATRADLSEAVNARCPDAFYDALNPAELEWCGSGRVLSRNFFNVVESGVALELPSFSVVDMPLLRKAKRIGADLSDYEIELFTAEIVSMAATSGFTRDWAAACRATL